MQSIIRKIVCVAACAALFGCADAYTVDSEANSNQNTETPTPQQPSTPSTPSTPTTPDPGPSTPTNPTQDPTIGSDPTKVEDTILNPADVCPTYRKCYNGNEFRFCKGGEIVSTTCPAGCDDNEGCVGYDLPSSCEAPIKLNTEKGYAKASTFSGTEYYTSACPGELASMMGVIQFEIPKLGFYKISLSTEGTTWGYIIAKSCDPKDEVTFSCGESAPSTSFTQTLDAGTYYAFVAPQSLFSKDFEFTLTVSPAQYDPNICGAAGATAKLIALNEESFEIAGSMTSTFSSSNFDGFSCMNMHTQGPEDVYMFSLTNRAKISASVNVTSKADEAPKSAAVYLKNCSNGAPNVIACSSADNYPSRLSVGQTLNPGDYLLYVDSGNTGYDYTLEIEKK